VVRLKPEFLGDGFVDPDNSHAALSISIDHT